jgi:transposase InsO family protein
MKVVPVVNITQEAAVKFLQSNIYRIGVSRRVLTDNGTQFKGVKFVRCCADFGIQHPQHTHRRTGKLSEPTDLSCSE